jgi:transaldolase/glucose-6-phosphate isomerase
MQERLPAGLAASFEALLDEWQRERAVARLWARDASLWTGRDEARWLGWLDLGRQDARVDTFASFARDVASAGYTDVLLLGMGGSSLSAAVLAASLRPEPGFPTLHVLDSVDPAEIRRVEQALDLARTVILVSSKSGTTIESDLLLGYFRDRLEARVGPRAPAQLVAITDAGSPLFARAERESFRAVFAGDADIGGRFSALSSFGLVPAALLGLDLHAWLARARAMAERCGPSVEPKENPGARLGLLLGAAGRSGRDKVTVVLSRRLATFGAWIEQLLAESTGKAGRALIPVDGEPLGPPEVYGDDRLFVAVRDGLEPDAVPDAALSTLARAGHPVVSIEVGGPRDLPAEFFRWAFAAAVAGAVLGVNPFDQPDVEASKAAARRWIAQWEQTGRWPPDEPVAEQEGIHLYAPARDREALGGPARGGPVAAWLAAHLHRLAPGRYFALLAFVDRHEAHVAPLEAIRGLVRDRCRVATTLGFGPRYLHSTGQAHKGGPNTGVFLLVTADDAVDLPVPGRRATFGAVKAAQARGDFEVLAARGRPILRVHLPGDVAAGLRALHGLVDQATRSR